MNIFNHVSFKCLQKCKTEIFPQYKNYLIEFGSKIGVYKEVFFFHIVSEIYPRKLETSQSKFI